MSIRKFLWCVVLLFVECVLPPRSSWGQEGKATKHREPLASESQQITISHKGYIPDAELPLIQRAFQLQRRGSLTAFSHRLPEWMAEVEMPSTAADQIESEVVRINEMVKLELGELLDVQRVLGENPPPEATNKYFRDYATRVRELESEISDNLFDRLSEAEREKLALILLRRYPMLYSWAHPFTAKVFGLTEDQVRRILDLAERDRVATARGMKSRRLSEMQDMDARETARVNAVLLSGWNILELEQLRTMQTVSRLMKPGESWTSWLKRYPDDFPELVAKYAPKLHDALATERVLDPEE